MGFFKYIAVLGLIFTLNQSASDASCVSILSAPEAVIDFPDNHETLYINTSSVEAVVKIPSLHGQPKKKVRHAVDLLEGSLPVKAVVYTNPGFDSSVGFETFDQATDVIALDSQPFWTETSGDFSPFSYRKGQVFSNILASGIETGHPLYLDTSVEKAFGGTALFSLARLKIAFPQAHFLQVIVFKEGTRSHGFIEFDPGDGTPVRRYYHIQTTNRKITEQWWFKGIENLHFKGLIRKGPRGKSILESQSQSLLEKNGGILLEDDQWSTETNLSLSNHAKTFKVKEPFGLAPGAKLTGYRP